MRYYRLGVLGHYYGGMIDVYTDLTKQSAVFGTHIDLLEMCELKKCRDEVLAGSKRGIGQNDEHQRQSHLARRTEPQGSRTNAAGQRGHGAPADDDLFLGNSLA
jgi:L-arabinose isomerase